jgi:hypothetical protein
LQAQGALQSPTQCQGQWCGEGPRHGVAVLPALQPRPERCQVPQVRCRPCSGRAGEFPALSPTRGSLLYYPPLTGPRAEIPVWLHLMPLKHQ